MQTNRALIPLFVLLCAPISLAQTSAAPPEATNRLDPPVITKLLPPPGPIEETMKTLEQVEPRTPANDLGSDIDWAIIIDQPGSYYLTEDVVPPFGKSGIDIRTSNVTLDLNGFRVDGRNTGEHKFSIGIYMQQNSEVRNGIVMNWNGTGVDAGASMGFSSGIDVRVHNITAEFDFGSGIIVGRHATVRNCIVDEVDGTGIRLGSDSIADHCSVSRCSAAGIANYSPGGATSFPAVIKDCIAQSCEVGIQSFLGAQIIACTTGGNNDAGYSIGRGGLVKDCVSIFDQVGFRLQSGTIAVNCTSAISDSDGFQSDGGASLTRCSAWNCNGNAFMPIPDGLPYDAKYKDCIASTCFGYGFLLVKPNGVIEGCDAVDNFFGITIEPGATDSIVESCNLYGNDAGLDCQADDTVIEHNKLRGPSPLTVSGLNNLIIRNSIEGGAAAVSIAPGNRDAAIVDHPDLAGPWSNLAY